MKRLDRLTFRIAAAAAAALLFLPAVLADEENPFERGTKDAFSISVGGFLMNFDSSATLDPENGGEGTDIDLERDLDLDDNANRWRIDGYWRFARKHRLDFGGYLFNRSNRRELDKRIHFGDTVYDVGTELNADTSAGLYKLAYRYSFIRNERIDLGASIGISAWSNRVKLEGEGSVNGSSASFDETSDRFIAPIPVLGVQMDLKIVKSLFFRVNYDYFRISVSDIDGKFSDGRASIDWYPFKHFGFGAGYNRVKLGAEDSSGAAFDVEYSFDGVLGYATYVY